MSANPQPEPERLEAAADQAIAACGGSVRDAVKALIVANEYLEGEVRELKRAVSHAYVRGRFQPYDMANSFMLITLFTLIADMAEHPDGFRTEVKKALNDLTDNYKLPEVAPAIAKEARDAAKRIIACILQEIPPVATQ